MNSKKALLIINPLSGLNHKRSSATEIMNSLSCADFVFTIKTTKCRGDATKIVTNTGAEHDLIICCGGDGTLNETINGVLNLDKKVPIGYIPLGTTNYLATTLGIPVGVGAATNMILNGNTNGYDVGLFQDRYFNYIASFGIACDIAYATPQKWKNIFGHTAYVIYGLGVRLIPLLRDFSPVHMKVEYDGGTVEDDFFFGAISNTTSVAGVFKYNDIKLNDGYFELLLIRGLKKNADILGILNKLIRKDYSGNNIIYTKTKNVKITCDEKVPWTLDGEFGGDLGNVEISVINKAYDIYSDNNNLFI